MSRVRPAPLGEEEVQAEFAVVVKNTFLEVSGGKVASGLLTAPASMAGSMRRSLSETPKWQLSRGASPGLTFDGGETETTASSPSHESLTTAAAPFWPPTPASPTAPVRISLVELTLGGREEGLSPASLAARCESYDAAAAAAANGYEAYAAEAAMMAASGAMGQHACGWDLSLSGDATCPQHCGWEFPPLGAMGQVPPLPTSSLDLPPPPGSPKLPMHFQAADSEPTSPPPAQDPADPTDRKSVV